MQKQTIDILTSFGKAQKRCVMGNVAVARGAIEAGVNGVFSYPGTPSTEISEVFNFVNDFQSQKEFQKKYPKQTEHKIYFEYSINEKIALEKAIAYSIGNKSAMCVMKNVGMNVASDALMSVTYQTIIAPLVIVLCDDPGCFSSSNEQDSRYWGKFASVPMFNPASPKDALLMTKEAFLLSAQLRLPVIVRMTTRVDHSRGMISYGKFDPKETIAHFDRLPQHINIPARTATAHKALLDKLDSELFVSLNEKYNTIFPSVKTAKEQLGIIASGVSLVYVKELLSRNSDAKNISVLKIGIIHPFPEKDILAFFKKGIKKVLILEELDPLLENDVRVCIQKNKIDCEVIGKGFSGLTVTGEYTLDIIRNVLEKFTSLSFKRNDNLLLPDVDKLLASLPPRPPTLCAGCPHRATFYALKLAVPRDNGNIILCGDIGCSGLGALPPIQMIDTINHMGMSVSMAQGLSEAMHLKPEQGKVVAMLGDGTFFHSGVASLINAIYTRANITVIIFDNRTIGMTGHQDHPGATQHSKYQQIDIYSLVKGLGVECVETMMPFNLKDTYDKVKNAINHIGVSVLIARAPCVFLPEFKEGALVRKSLYVDESKCNTCFNHCDVSISCSKEQSPKESLERARAKIVAKEHVYAQDQLCPANICNHGFFNSILSKNYKSALEIVRDKMLFASVCGDICHKPCESLFRTENGKSVPIKKLKNFVSNIEGNFNDFSKQISRVKTSNKKNKKVAVIGAGPAGLSSAYDLVQAGYEVTVFEKNASAGGMIRFVIPDFRMNKNNMDKEMNVLMEMGVRFKFNSILGKNISIEKLSSDYDAVVIAIGMWSSATLEVVEKNVSIGKKFDAINFLRSYNEKSLKIKSGSTIFIVGGGNSAMDAARAAKRLNKKNNVIVSCIEKFDAMPAFIEEIEEAKKEGIHIIDNSYADLISEKKNKISASLKSFDKKKTLETIEADYIITAIGQRGDKSAVNDKLSLDTNFRVKSASKYKNVFVAGDIASGNHISLIGAIGSGKKAAVNVRKLLEGYKFEYEGEFALDKLSNSENGNKNILRKFETIDFEIENVHDYNLFQPCAKCDHCIENFGCPAMVKVNGKIIIDDKRCTRCGLCIDVCPNGAIAWV